MSQRNLFFPLIILLSFSIPVFSTITEAREVYKQGNYNEALVIYNDWLEENSESEELYTILMEISGQKGDIDQIISILTKYSELINKREERKSLYKKLAELFLLTGDLKDAQKYYLNASLINIESIDYETLLESAKLLILQGEFINAESQLKEIIIKTDNDLLKTSADIYYRVLRIIDSGEYNDRNSITVSTPENSYLLYLIAGIESDNVSMEKLINYLKENYALSPESSLLDDSTILYPNIISSFGLMGRSNVNTPEPESQNYMIQAGSFRDPENAKYLLSDLAEKGFSPVVEEQIINEQKYYKVLLYFSTQSESNSALLRLKREGFDGFPIY